MGAVDDFMGDIGGWLGEDVAGGLTGQTAAENSLLAAQMQQQSAAEALAYQKEKDALARGDLTPTREWGQSFMPFYSAFMNPQAQASWLESNPMFQAAINRSETGLKNTLGFQGKRGDLADAITQNYMSTGSQYVQQHLNNMLSPIQLGQASAAGQAANTLTGANAATNLITGSGAAGAAGLIGASNAQQAGLGNLAQIGGGILGAFMSDRRMKKHVTRIGSYGPYNVYAWQYRGGDDTIHIGVMADEVKQINPSAVVNVDGFDAVLYGLL
jgi:hypothetical protein